MKDGRGSMEASREKRMVQVQQNEIDLMDLFKIIYKNRIMIGVITIIVTLASLGGALYINVEPNKDSLAPIIDFIKADIKVLMESFEWN